MPQSYALFENPRSNVWFIDACRTSRRPLDLHRHWKSYLMRAATRPELTAQAAHNLFKIRNQPALVRVVDGSLSSQTASKGKVTETTAPPVSGNTI